MRAVLTAAEKNGGHAALGVDEWQVLAETPERLESIDLRTGVGQPPALPATVTAWYADHRSAPVGVSWPQLDPSRLGAEGRIDMRGIADGGAPVAATIWVRATEPGQVNTVDALADIATTTGEAPELPAFATVQYNDGSRERRPVAWSSVAAADYAKPGRFAVTGEVSGRGNGGRLPVKIQVVVSGD